MGHVLTPPDRDRPIGQRGAMGDRNGAMALAFGMASALLRRERTGRGSVVDVSLLATAMWTLSSDVLAALQGGTPRAMASREDLSNPLVGTYRTSDGRHIQLVFLQGDRYWADLCALLGRPDLAADPRFADMASRRENRVACMAELDAEFGRRTFAGCKELLSRLDAPWAPIQAVEELLDDPQVVANGYIGTVSEDGPEYRLPAVPVQLDEQPPPLRRAPEHGEHTETVLLELGYTWEDITALRESGVLA
jgi:crotonobetainyl-CoA:carnitine CoA-transferase CaiB-like acyl-CoA transferase